MELAAILALVEAGIALAKEIPAAVHALKQSGELTPEEEAILDKKIDELKGANAPEHWKL